MKITVEFESVDEFEAFKTSGKKTRTKKEEAAEAAAEGATVDVPAPIQPPAGAPTFNPPNAAPAPFAAQAPTFAAPAAPAVDPAVTDLVGKIVERWNGSVTANPATADGALKFFRDQIGADAASATADQIQNVLLPKLPLEQLKKIAPLLGIAA